MAVESTMQQLGAPAPDFALREVVDGSIVSLDDAKGEALVVAFLSKHCPYVQHIQDALAAVAREYLQRNVAFVGISSNDPGTHPDDAPENLAVQKRDVGFGFPYLFDETQQVALAYGAACTPDFFVYDADRKLAYRGRFDETRPGQGQPTGNDLRAALDHILAGKGAPQEQVPSMGCGVKWRPENDPNA